MNKPVVLLPADPRTSGPSMVRHWASLWGAARKDSGCEVSSFLGEPPAFGEKLTANGGFAKQRAAFTKYVGYPVRLKLTGPRNAVYHLLDHSYGHLIPWIPKKSPIVATVHDLIPLRFRGEMSARQFERWRKGIDQLRKADFLMADSAYTKSEIEELLGIPGDKIAVVPLGVDIPAGPPVRSDLSRRIEEFRQDSEVVLVGCLGSGIARKNLGTVIRAVTELRAKGYPVKMVRAGSGMPETLQEAAADLVSQNAFLNLGMIDDEAVGEFYSSLDGLIMPSFYEGFGLPVLEAMAHGTPVVSSTSTSLPEVAGDAAVLFKADDLDSLIEAIQQVMSPIVRFDLKQRGLIRAREFSWEKTWQKGCHVYHRFS